MRLPWSSERGSVTAETAVLLPGLALVFVFLLFGARAAADQLAAQDAALIAARAAARGESSGEIERLARQVAPQDSSIAITRENDLIRVQVTVLVHPPGPAAVSLPAVTVTGSAVAAPEPSPQASS